MHVTIRGNKRAVFKVTLQHENLIVEKNYYWIKILHVKNITFILTYGYRAKNIQRHTRFS